MQSPSSLPEGFEEVPKAAILASKYLADAVYKLGKPHTPLTPSGQKVMAIIHAIWEELYPLDAKTWRSEIIEYQTNEMGIREQVAKQTGRSLASIPLPIFQMMTRCFPNYKLDTRDQWLKFLKKYPVYRVANKL